MTKKILGLDLGTNSIGWALVEQDFENKEGKILGMGSRIIPMSQDIKDEFGKGNSISQTAARTNFRSIRRLRERHLLRRERLHRIMNVLGFLPKHYASKIDFKKRLGQFFEETEPKLSYNNGNFIFKSSFQEMLEDFRKKQPDLLNRKNKKGEAAKIPYDWTIYYLRKKALSQKLEKEELAWLLLNFNQKRGYYQLRGEDEDTTKKVKEYVVSLKITFIEKGEKDKKNEQRNWYNIYLENGWIYSATFATEPTWINTEKEFLVTEELDENENVKIIKGKRAEKVRKEKRKISLLPTFEEIDLMSKKDQDKIYKKIKAKTEITINNSGKTVGAYIYDTLLKNPNQKIKGKLVRTIEREFYKKELEAILKKQIELHPELFTSDLFNDCIRELYRNNGAQQTTLSNRDFVYLFVDDIIFYQRPLRSQKSSIGNCSLEYRTYKIKDENGILQEVKEYLKGISKSNPLYQEFRLWQWLYNLKIYTKEDDKDVTADFINSVEDIENLFDFLNSRKEVNHKDILTYLLAPKIKAKYPDAKAAMLNKEISKGVSNYRWNYVFDDSKENEEEKSKKYPCNETGTQITSCLAKVANVPAGFLTKEKELQLWHVIYSVTDKIEFEKALKTFANKNNLDEISFVENFKKFPPFKSEYGSYSEKAIKKLLPLMRKGKYWNWNSIDTNVQNRIDKILTGEFDETIKDRVREKAIHLSQKENFQGLQLWLAQYIVYGRHSEAEIANKWKTANDLEKYLKKFKQHSLRNPIVEQLITETLRVVKDIWQKYGNGAENYFDEIHIELGREMKNTAEDREKITKQVTENEITNLRIKTFLMEFANDDYFKNKEDYKDENGKTPNFYKKGNNPIKPYSQGQHDILKIFEEGVLNNVSNEELDKETGITETKDGKTKKITYKDISKKSQPTKAEVDKYKLWLEQKYQSPYTGKMIPLSKLFTPEYQIEHVIPQARYFDDSFSNKVICEASVNKLKDKQLGLEFIKKHHGEKVQDGEKIYEILTEEKYKEFVNEHYKNNRSKRNKLLMDEIPDRMIERQLNDTRYISKFISNLLSNIVRAETNDDGINSKNILPGNGKITTTLKQDWGLNDVWNNLILPRFERMNELTQSGDFTAKNKEGHTIPNIPLKLSKGFQKKRIDHRHHAMDALVIACATRDHIQYLNNENAKSQKIHLQMGLARKLRAFEWIEIPKWGRDDKGVWKESNEKIKKEVPKKYFKPWETFTQDTKNELEQIIVSFKQNLRIINKTTNKYEKYVEQNREMVKELVTQILGDSWAIRKPMHKDTVSGKVYLLNGMKEITFKNALGKVNEIKDVNIIVDTDKREIIKKYFIENKIDIENSLKEDSLKNFKKIKVFEPQSATRQGNDLVSIFKDVKNKDKAEEIIKKITDTGIQKILRKYLTNKNDNPELAFSPEGLNEMNKNILQYNDGKAHQPIYKVRIYETMGNKFNVGIKGNKKTKFVEAAKGSNLFFAVYHDENGKRSYDSISLNIAIERQKQGLKPVELKSDKDFYLSPNDLVYVPTEDELENVKGIDFANLNKEQMKRIYKFTDGSGVMANFIPVNIAEVIFSLNKEKQGKINVSFPIQNEIGVGSQGSKNERAISGETIKNVCIKIKVDRLGNITKA